MGTQSTWELCLSYQKNKMSAASTSAKATKPKAKKPAAAKSGNPTSSVMVKAAIEGLKERKGSSLVAIKKYIATNYKIDPSKHSHFIKKALTSGVEKKTIVQTRGTGASGSFKLAKVEVKKACEEGCQSKNSKEASFQGKENNQSKTISCQEGHAKEESREIKIFKPIGKDEEASS